MREQEKEKDCEKRDEKIRTKKIKRRRRRKQGGR